MTTVPEATRGRLRRPEALTPARARTSLAFLAAVAVFAIGEVLHPGFGSAGSIKAILLTASFVGFVAAGQTFVVLIGGIDLSVPWVLNGAAILLVTTSLGQDGRAAWAIPLTLAMGLGVGLMNGLAVALLSVPAVVITLAMNGVAQGLTLGLSQGLTCSSCASYAPPVLRHAVTGHALGIPGGVLLWAGVALLITFLLGYTTFGRRVYAIGNNPQGSFLAGINVRLITVILYMLSGMFAAFAGITLAAYGGQASLGMGDPYLFQSIAAVVIGGVSILGGRGNYLGSSAGSITLVALVTLLLAENMADWGRDVVYGGAILLILLLYGREKKAV